MGVHSTPEARGVRGHAPQEIFEKIGALRCILVQSQTQTLYKIEYSSSCNVGIFNS